VKESKKTASIATAVEAGWMSDPECAVALLEAHRKLDLPGLLSALLLPCVRWSDAICGFGLGPGGEEGQYYVPLAVAPKARDERAKAFAAVDPVRLDPLLTGQATLFDGLGPLAIRDGWTGDLPAHCLKLAVAGETEGRAGALFLMFAENPGTQALARIDTLLHGARPAVDNSIRVQAMRELVIKDDTAHCFNRRYFEQCMPEELSRAGRFHSSLSLIFLDMDNLKQVNNQYGHAMGSRTLYEVSVRVRAKIRKFDKLFRFGGDEFCIVLPETDWSGAKEVALRVRDSISGQPFLVRELDSDGGVGMTASLGIASYPYHARTQQELIEAADRAMQKIKRSSKDGVGIAENGGRGHE